MTFLPLVERELRIATRKVSTYRIRTLAAGIVTLVAIVMMLFGVVSSLHSQVGKAMFHTLAFMTMLLCFLEGAWKTADCLSEEQREGTLGLLFLTDLKGYDVVFGKFVAASLNSFYCLFALLPILALALLLGGVVLGEFWRMALALANILFFSLSVGIWVSANSRSERRAMGGALLFILILGLGPLISGNKALFPLSPVAAYRSAFEVVYRLQPENYWRSILITQGICWSLLIWAACILPHRFQNEFARGATSPWRERWKRWQRGSETGRAKLRTQMLDINPAYWLAGRNFGQRLLLWLVIVTVAGSLVVFLPILGIDFWAAFLTCAFTINFILKAWLATQACHCLAEARHNNALEMLLSTPLTADQIIRGQILSLRRIFLVPIVIILGLEIVGLAGGISLMQTGARGESIGYSIFLGIVYLGIFAIDVMTLTWTGMWFGLSAKNETTAIVKTIVYILVLPFLGTLFCWFGVFFFIGWPIFWGIWSHQKLRAEFRSLAANRYLFKPQETGWLPFAGKRAPAPPIIYPRP